MLLICISKFFDNITDIEKKINGMKYRLKMLEPGSSKDSIDLLLNFLEEKPNNEYFLKEKGLK